MKIEIIVGSHRIDSQSNKVGQWISSALSKESVETGLISLSGNPIPLWSEAVFSGDNDWKAIWQPISSRLKAADGFVFITPEWGGMVPPGLKNFLLLCSPKEVGHKPALIVSISAGEGGAYPVAELRSTGYKNNRILFIPEHVIIRRVEQFTAAESPSDTTSDVVADRLIYGLKILTAYAEAAQHIRTSEILDFKNFPYGQ